jgi:serine protease Do
MSTHRARHFLTLTLIFGAVVFGMVLAGGLGLSTPGTTDPVSPDSPDQAISPPPIAAGLPSFADLAERVSQAVVSVESIRIETARRPQRGQDPFEFFFGPRGRRDEEEEGEPREFRSESGGSGFVISEDGDIVTNYHVIDGATEVRIHLGDRDYPAEVVGTDPATDIALLRIDAGRPLSFLALGDSDEVRVGDWVMAIGNPLGLQNAVSVGVVSGKGRQIAITADTGLENFIQTDAAINFGNSGGPLVDLEAQVVGINTAINFGSENIGFAVPANILSRILPQLRESGRVTRGYLGVQIGELDHESAEAFGLDSTNGVLVQVVEPDTPAEKAGLEHGDILLRVDGNEITDSRSLISHVSSLPPETPVELDLIRDGKSMKTTVVLGERPSVGGEPDEEEEEEESGIEWLGLEYQDLTSRLRSSHGLSGDVDGVWVTDVSATSPLFEENVRPGDIITEVNGEEISGVDEFEEAILGLDSGSFIRLYVLRFDGRGNRPAAFFALARVP